MSFYEAWLSMHAGSTRQRLQQTVACSFADDLNRPNSQNPLLAQAESTRIGKECPFSKTGVVASASSPAEAA